LIATGLLSGIASLGVDKIFGKGQRGGFMIPRNKIDQLIKYNLLKLGQKKKILEALQTDRKLVIKPTAKQSGGVLGTQYFSKY